MKNLRERIMLIKQTQVSIIDIIISSINNIYHDLFSLFNFSQYTSH